MKPGRRTPAHSTPGFAELVCSNSLGNDGDTTAAGLLKAELRAAGSIVMQVASGCAVPAGGALAVDRERFSDAMTRAIRSLDGIEVAEKAVDEVPGDPLVIVATGPMTAPPLSVSLLRALDAAGSGDGLHYWDAIAPIVEADSVDLDLSFRADRWKMDAGGDYVNCPMDEPTYMAFVQAILDADRVGLEQFEEPAYYEGCLPIEVLASRGPATLAFGPLRPAGLVDPRTGTRPHAVLQLRSEDARGYALNLVGCQTRMTRPAQQRVLRMVPALHSARFLRFGQVHRNTFVDAPRLLGPFGESLARPGLFVTGQLCGVEGYMESTAAGLLTALAVARRVKGEPAPHLPPPTTACGGLLGHVSGRPEVSFQPSGMNWSLVRMPALQRGQKKHLARKKAFWTGIEAMRAWLEQERLA